jgi:hypothetical protein
LAISNSKYVLLGTLLVLLALQANAGASFYLKGDSSHYARYLRVGNSGFPHIATYLGLLDLLEYTFDVNGSQIFPNETIKQQVIYPGNNNATHVYNLTEIQYSLAGFNINASGVTIHVNSTKVDDNHTRLDLTIYAERATVNGADNLQQYSRSFDKVTLRSLYGIYDKTTDKVTVHVPYLALLPFF